MAFSPLKYNFFVKYLFLLSHCRYPSPSGWHPITIIGNKLHSPTAPLLPYKWPNGDSLVKYKNLKWEQLQHDLTTTICFKLVQARLQFTSWMASGWFQTESRRISKLLFIAEKPKMNRFVVFQDIFSSRPPTIDQTSSEPTLKGVLASHQMHTQLTLRSLNVLSWVSLENIIASHCTVH